MLDEKYVVERIKELCQIHNMSMYAISKKTGISQSSLSNLLHRESVPTFTTLSKICDAFGITLSQFFAEGGVRLDLTEEQKKVLNIWDSLSEREKEKVTDYIQGISASKKIIEE